MRKAHPASRDGNRHPHSRPLSLLGEKEAGGEGAVRARNHPKADAGRAPISGAVSLSHRLSFQRARRLSRRRTGRFGSLGPSCSQPESLLTGGMSLRTARQIICAVARGSQPARCLAERIAKSFSAPGEPLRHSESQFSGLSLHSADQCLSAADLSGQQRKACV